MTPGPSDPACTTGALVPQPQPQPKSVRNPSDGERTQAFLHTSSRGGGAGYERGLSGARAEGGPVKKGEAYLVGEDGPEPFIPDTNGAIIPNGGGGGTPLPMGGTTVTNHITINMPPGSDGRDIVAQIKRFRHADL